MNHPSALVVPPPPQGSLAHRVVSATNALLGPLGVKLVRKDPSSHQFIQLRSLVREAKKRNLTVLDCIAELWKRWGNPDPERHMAERLREAGVFDAAAKRVCEIGPGTGMGLRTVLKYCQPEQYEIYETARDWRNWLVKEYGVLARPTDGATLSSTSSASVDLVHAHGVFVCLPFLTTMGYLAEMARVVKPGGFLVFDVLTEDCFPVEALQRWLDSPHRYPVFISRQFVTDFLVQRGMEAKRHFLAQLDAAQSEYLVFRKALHSVPAPPAVVEVM